MPRFLWRREGHVSLAWELLVAKRIRPVIAIAGVAVSVVLIVVVIALYRGWQDTGSALVRPAPSCAAHGGLRLLAGERSHVHRS